jgi:predicted AAA+ superfamily ATPase
MNGQIDRLAATQLEELVQHLRVVMVGGPRQAGKTTLLKQYLAEHTGSYRSLDQLALRESAGDDPTAFVGTGRRPRVIDEVQLGGDALVREIKLAVDEDPRPGGFILSGSSRFLDIPTLSESLAGRIAFIELWPLSMAERTGWTADPIGRLFGDPEALLGEDSEWDRRDYLELFPAGGYPEAIGISSELARAAWFEGYLSTVINRDIRTFAEIAHGHAVAQLLAHIAIRAGSLAVVSDLAESVELARQTTKNYLSYLDMVYLTVRLPPWSTNKVARLVKSPKLYPADSGLAAHLLGVNAGDLVEPGHPALGPLVETFVISELVKAVANSQMRAQLFHARTGDKHEVDVIIEGPGGKLVAIEIKASTSPGAGALKGLRWLKESLGDRLHAGYLLHLGRHAVSRGSGLYALPLSTLWGNRPL